MRRASEALTRLPSRCDYTTTNKFLRDGVPFTVEVSGSATYADYRYSRTELTGIAYRQSDPTRTAQVRALTVLDGAYMWMEIHNELLGAPSVTKGPLGPGPGPPGVIAMVANLASNYDLRVVGIADGRVRLEGTLAEAPYHAVVVLDEGSARPIEILLGTDPESVHLRIRSWSFPETTDPTLFVYSPPEGVTVTEIFADSIAARE